MEANIFSKYIDSVTNAGYTCTLLSLGYELGLFELMIGQNKQMTSNEIADKARMKERYIREWLAGVVAAKIVNYDVQTKSYHIPDVNHASLLTSAARARGVAAIGARKEAVKKCFMIDGPNGLTYDHDDTWWAWFGHWRKVTSRSYVENDIVPCFRKHELGPKLESGITVLDACCGSGDLTFEFAKLFPNSTFTGVDISVKPIELANNKTNSTGVTNLKFSNGDVQSLSNDVTERFDMVMILDALHDLPDPYKVLNELSKVMKPGGYFVCTDFLPGSNIQDDVGDLRAAAHYSITVNNCVPFKLSLDPNIEREKSWGRDDMDLAVKTVFQFEHRFDISKNILLFVSRKKERLKQESLED